MQRDLEKREWLLRRNCSLTPRQTALAYGAVCALSLAVGGCFALLGYPIILLFTLAEIIALGAAFLYYARHAGDYEYIVLTAGCLLVERVSAGKATQVVLDPCWTRVAMPARRGSLVGLEARGAKIEIGGYAPDAQRRRVARELQGELSGGGFS